MDPTPNPRSSKRPRILIVGQHFWPESFRINDIAQFFLESGIEVDVLCGMPNYPEGNFFQGYSWFHPRKESHDGVTIYRTPEIPRGTNSNFRIFLNYISFPITSLLRVPQLSRENYDRIFIYQISPVLMGIAGIAIGKLSRTQTIMYVLDPWPENLYSVIPVKSRIVRRLAETVSHFHYKNVDKIAVLSEKMRSHFAKITKLDSDHLVVIPQSSELIYESPIFDEHLHRRFEGKFKIVFTGNISPAQSFETVLEAASELKSRGLEDIHWIVVGDGMSREWLEGEVEASDLTDIFSFEGHQPISLIPHYTELADVLIGCLASSEFLDAAIPAKIISYLAAGKPIVVAMDGEVATLINEDVKCGFAGPAEDSKTFAENILRVYKLTQDERSKLGIVALEYHRKNLSRNFVLEKLLEFIFQ
jgi:colanic acid biosynthesis glycosyl transferase WcaI